MITEPINIKL